MTHDYILVNFFTVQTRCVFYGWAFQKWVLLYLLRATVRKTKNTVEVLLYHKCGALTALKIALEYLPTSYFTVAEISKNDANSSYTL